MIFKVSHTCQFTGKGRYINPGRNFSDYVRQEVFMYAYVLWHTPYTPGTDVIQCG